MDYYNNSLMRSLYERTSPHLCCHEGDNFNCMANGAQTTRSTSSTLYYIAQSIQSYTLEFIVVIDCY